ncbi:hypothetical protein LJ655_18675 [Paraburkholderia sp. MMS20-SJTN17]|uniref:KTSC domain-containing protein n=1 Tax=Paraburkholderia translucens TaxID=2886945 RepID=A0ABS8KGL8_9BURK|nr:hypothetical protein [Paraburkholderia sp. MMS20-SJTN17]MCC8403888.1 hypothetical protein [Paraburkholderia sp. MMS20-SJTN17]
MRNISSIVMSPLAVLLFIVSIGADAYADEATLCQLHEEVYFSCQTENKIISLCASGNISPNNGYVQYRFGTLDQIELQYPDRPYPPKNRFLISDVAEGSVSFTHVKFKSGEYNYVIYQGFPSGLYIKRKGKLVSNLTCGDGIYQRLSQRAYRGMRTAPPVAGVDN